MSKPDDPFGDKAHLAAKRAVKRRPPPTLDPALPDVEHHLPPDHKHRVAERPPTPAERAGGCHERKQTRYRYLDGKTDDVSTRMLAALELHHFHNATRNQIARATGLSSSGITRSLTTPKALRIGKDMLARLESGLHSRALVAQNDILGQRGDLKTLALVARDVRDRVEGRPVQTSVSLSEHTETVRFVVDARPPTEPEAPGLAMVKDPVTGRYVQAEERERMENADTPAPHESRTDDDEAA